VVNAQINEAETTLASRNIASRNYALVYVF